MRAPDMIRIVNTKAHLIHLPNAAIKPEVRDRDGKITSPAVMVDGARLGPGGNNVRRDYWHALISRTDRPGEVVRAMVDAGEIKEDPRKGAVATPEGPEPPKSLSDMKPRAALAMIDGMGRIDVLSAWLRKERRKPIRDALAVKISALGGSVTDDGLRKQAVADLPDPSESEDEGDTDGDESADA